MGGRPCQAPPPRRAAKAAAMSAVATGMEVAPNAIARGTGDTPESIRPG